MPYKGFISYSHIADLAYAPALQHALHQFARPFYSLRALRIFRDQTDLSTNPALWPVIQRALDESEYFLLLASPKAAQSKWVKRELDYWLRLHRGSLDKLLIVWTEGEIVWDEEKNDFDWERTTALPKTLDWGNAEGAASLENRFKEQPFYLDQRWAKKEEDLSLRNPRFLDEVATLAATLHDKPKADMIGEDVNEHRKYRRARTIAAALLLVFAVLAGGFGVYANQQRIEAEAALRLAEDRRRGEELQRKIAQEKTEEAVKLARAETAARAEAERQTDIAEEQRQEAVKQQHRAEEQTLIAEERRKEAERERNIALSRQYAATARSELPNDPVLSVRRASEGLRRADTAEAEDALRLSLAQSYVRLILPGQAEVVRAVYSADGSLVAAAYSDGTAAVWDAVTGGRRHLLVHHTKVLNGVAFSPDGRSLVTSGEDKAAVVWDVRTGRVSAALGKFPRGVRDAVFTRDGAAVVTTSDDQTRVWDARSGRLIKELMPRSLGANSVAFNRDGNLLVTAQAYYRATVWRTDNWTLHKELHVSSFKEMMTAVFSPDGSAVLTSGADGLARVWNLETGEVSFTLSLSDREKDLVHPERNAPRGDVTAQGDLYSRMWSVASYSPDGKLVMTADEKLVRVWDAKMGRKLREFDHEGAEINSASFSGDGKYLVTTDNNNTARVWAAETGDMIVALRGHGDVVRGAQFDPSSQRVLTASADRTARVWEFGLGKLKAAVPVTEEEGELSTLVFSPEGRLFVALHDKAAARVWDAVTGERLARLDGGGAPVVHAAFSADGRRVFTIGKTVRALDARTGRRLFDMEGGGLEALSEYNLQLAVSDKGALIAAPSAAGKVLVWDAQTGRKVAETDPTGTASDLSFSRDGEYLVTNGDMARLWVARTGKVFRELPVEDEHISTVRLSPDKRKVVVVGEKTLHGPQRYQYSVRLWDVTTGRVTLLSERSPHLFYEAAFSPDSRYLLAAGSDGFLRIWDAGTGEVFYAAEVVGGAAGARFSPDGKLILITRPDGMVRILDVRSKESFLLFDRHEGKILPASFSRDGRNVLTAGRNGTGTATAMVYECEVCAPRRELLELARSRMLPLSILDARARAAAAERHRLALLFDPADPARSRVVLRRRVNQIIADNIDSEALDGVDGKISAEQSLAKDLEVDEEGMSKLFIKLGAEFGVRFPGAKGGGLKTVGDVYEYVESQLLRKLKAGPKQSHARSAARRE